MVVSGSQSGSNAVSHLPGMLALWVSVAAGPAAVAIEQWLDFILVHWACLNGAQWVLRLVDLIALLIAAAAVLLAVANWSRAGRGDPDDKGGGLAAIQFMALAGIGLGSISFLLILGHGISMFLMGVCQ